MDLQVQKDIKEIAVKGLINGAVVAGISKYAFDEAGQVLLPFLNRAVDVSIPLALAGVASSVISDTTGHLIRENLPIPLDLKNASNLILDVVVNGGSLALATWGLVGFDDLQNVLMTMGVGAGSKVASNYIAEKVVLRSKDGFIL